MKRVKKRWLQKATQRVAFYSHRFLTLPKGGGRKSGPRRGRKSGPKGRKSGPRRGRERGLPRFFPFPICSAFSTSLFKPFSRFKAHVEVGSSSKEPAFDLFARVGRRGPRDRRGGRRNRRAFKQNYPSATLTKS